MLELPGIDFVDEVTVPLHVPFRCVSGLSESAFRSELLRESLIRLTNTKLSTDKEQLLALAVTLALPDRTPGVRQMHLEAAFQREGLFSTAFGRGVAAPHVYTPHVNRPIAAWIQFDPAFGIDFDSLDGELVRIIGFNLFPTDQSFGEASRCGTHANQCIKVFLATSRLLGDPAVFKVKISEFAGLIKRSI